MASKVRRYVKVGEDPITGAPIKENFCGKTKKAVQAKIDARKAEMRNYDPYAIDPVPFCEWANKWLAAYKEGKVEATTYNGYDSSVKKLNGYFGTTPLHMIRPVDLLDFFKPYESMSASLVSKLAITTKNIFESAIDNGYAHANPMKNLKVKGVEPEEKRAYDTEQFKALVAYAQEHIDDGLGPYIIINTGLRRGELMGLKRENLDLKNGFVHVRQTITDVKGVVKVRPGGKNKHAPRSIPLQPDVVDFLDQLVWQKKRLREINEWIFKNRDGRYMSPKSWARNPYERFMTSFCAENPKIPKLAPHELRHTFGTLLYRGGTDLLTIKNVMGHATIEITAKIYIHEDETDMKNNIRWTGFTGPQLVTLNSDAG